MHSRDSVTGIVSSMGRFHAYPMTLSQESCHPQGAFICIESTKTLDISQNFSYFLNLQYESRRLTSYLFKVNIGRTVVQLEDRRTDGRNTFSSLKSYDETRRDDIEKSRSSVRPMLSYGRTIANPAVALSQFGNNPPNLIFSPHSISQ